MESKSENKHNDIELTQSDISKTHQTPFGEDNEYIVNKDTDSILKNSINESNKKWRFEGVNIVVLSVVVLSTAITIALIFSIIFGKPQVVPQGAVAVDDDLCGQIGLNIMRENKGNAVDAMVSVMLCLAVTRPDVASLGGCGAVLVRDRNKQLSHLFDFTCPVRNSATEQDKPDKNKPASLVGIPSLVRGLAVMHQRFGSLKWSDLFTGAIDLTKKAFMPSKSLIEAANKLKTLNSPDFLKPILNQLIDENTPYSPSVELRNTLEHLANQRDGYFYSTNANTFNRQFVDYMKQQGSQWSLEDLNNYTVDRPNAIKMGFAGFTLESFPPPLVGGPYILLLLGNLDLKDTLTPLDHRALLNQDPIVTTIYLHRLMELARLAEASVTTLGDLSDPTINVAASSALDSIFSKSAREATVASVLDDRVVKEHSQQDVLKTTSEGASIGDTGIVTTDSTSFTVVGNIFMGSPFGNGQIVPGTGVHLNSMLQLFSETKLNKFAPGRRPLIPIGPVYLSATHRKCGIRAGIVSIDGLWGLTDAAQVICNAALFLRGTKCQPPKTLQQFQSITTINHKKEQIPILNDHPHHHIYSPAIEKNCINPNYATNNLTRIHPNYNISKLSSITLEYPFNDDHLNLIEQLKQLNYNHIELLLINQWPGRVFLIGWNGYHMISTGDNHSFNSKTLYTF
uniref:Gamma-glutamyltransferase-like protein 3 (T03 family) n=1 Tax=Schistosoma mansoni TaxID=6183 RepID=A0A3Q0KIW6_SCHMA